MKKIVIIIIITGLFFTMFSCSGNTAIPEEPEAPQSPVLPELPVFDIQALIPEIESVIDPLIEMIPDTFKTRFESKYKLWEETFWKFNIFSLPLNYYPNSEEFKDLCSYCSYFEKGLWPLAIKKIVSNRTKDINIYYPQAGGELRIRWYHHLLIRELGEPVYGHLLFDALSVFSIFGNPIEDINKSVIFSHLILENEIESIRRAVERFDVITYKQ